LTGANRTILSARARVNRNATKTTTTVRAVRRSFILKEKLAARRSAGFSRWGPSRWHSSPRRTGSRRTAGARRARGGHLLWSVARLSCPSPFRRGNGARRVDPSTPTRIALAPPNLPVAPTSTPRWLNLRRRRENVLPRHGNRVLRLRRVCRGCHLTSSPNEQVTSGPAGDERVERRCHNPRRSCRRQIPPPGCKRSSEPLSLSVDNEGR